MKLVVLVEEFYPNDTGGALTRWRFCQQASERGHDVTVFTPRREGSRRYEVVDGVEIRRPYRTHPERIPVYSHWAFPFRIFCSLMICIHVLWWIRNREINAVHSASHLLHWVGKVVSVLYRLDYVTLVDYTPSLAKPWSFTPAHLLERINFRLFMGDIVFCRQENIRKIISKYTNNPVRILHGVLHTQKIRAVGTKSNRIKWRNKLGVSNNEQLVAFVGRMSPLKQPGSAIKIASKLGPRFRFVLVGDGSELPAVEREISRCGIDDRVTLTGHKPHLEALGIMAASDALLLTSRTESYSSVGLEALSLGCHVFSTPVGVLSQLDHPRLHIGELKQLPVLMNSVDFDTDHKLDETLLERYSMEAYTSQLLSALIGD